MHTTDLYWELATPAPLSLTAREWLATAVLPILELAERRITESELQQLESIVATLPEDPPARGPSDFRIQFWSTIARATRNPIVEHKVRWWARAMREREQRTGIDSTGPVRIIPKSTYRDLIRRLRTRTGATTFWLNVIRQMLE
jgi:DNA-binding FadR family transcriptional regulator